MIKQKILLVEDDSSLLETCRLFLDSEGFDVSVAKDGEAGLNLASARGFDLIITDNQMPVMNGTVMVERLRENNNFTPVIVCTADTKAECPTARAIIQKPFDLEHFLSTIRESAYAV